MKQYIVNAESEFDKGLQDSIEKILKATGGRIVREGQGYTVLVEASEEAVSQLQKLKGVHSVEEHRIQKIPRPGVKPPRFGL